jgi:hypothetical protein
MVWLFRIRNDRWARVMCVTVSDSARLVEYIRSCVGFQILNEIDGNYGHIGATLADAVLQSNNNYERNVRQRIVRIRQHYADTISLKELKRLIARISVQEFLSWNGSRKPKTFSDLVNLLDQECVDTEEDLRHWLKLQASAEKLLDIPFVGRKTIDYLKILVGLPYAAMDRHLFGFLQEAGLTKSNYPLGQDIVHGAADLLSLDRACLDHSIWRYMSGGRNLNAVRRTDCEY